jgi:lysophospholipase L1-like esterase
VDEHGTGGQDRPGSGAGPAYPQATARHSSDAPASATTETSETGSATWTAPAPAPVEPTTPGRRDAAICFIGDSLVAGYGDPKALGWVGRVVSRSQHPDLDLTAYNLGVRGQDSGDVLARWRGECMPRWSGRAERRLVVSMGINDLRRDLTTARSRLNLANILDDASAKGIPTFVVGPTPTLDAGLNPRIDALAQAQADDCYRPLAAHEQWLADLAAGDGGHPGQAGYGLVAWLVLHGGWGSWLGI